MPTPRRNNPRMPRRESFGSKMGPGPFPKPNGFTLMEILIALALVSILFTSLFAVFDTVTDVAENVDHTARLSQEARLVALQLQRDLGSLSSITPRAGNQNNATAALSGYSPDQAADPANQPVLAVTTHASLDFNSTFPSQSQARVAYYFLPETVGDTETTPGLYRRARPLLPQPEFIAPSTDSLLLSTHLTDIQVQFFDPDLGMAVSNWPPQQSQTANEAPSLPLWATVRLTFTDEQNTTLRYAFFHAFHRPDAPPPALPEY